MNQAQVEKLKNLIGSSPLLNAVERTEWNALLELMNDKQLNELEKILSTHFTPSPARSMSAPASGPAVPQSSPIKRPEPSVRGGASFSHIMNMPADRPVVAKAPLKAPPVPNVGILGRIKQAFLQKELSTDRQEFELELPAPKTASQPKPAAPPPAPVKQPAPVSFKEKTAPLPPRPVPPSPIKEKFTSPPPPLKPFLRPEKIPEKTPEKTQEQRPVIIQNIEHQEFTLNEAKLVPSSLSGGLEMHSQNATVLTRPKTPASMPTALQPEKPQAAFKVQLPEHETAKLPTLSEAQEKQGVTGLNFAKFSSVGTIKASSINSLPVSVIATPSALNVHLREGSLQISSLEEVKNLTVATFQKNGGAPLSRELRKIMKEGGYHSVLFNLEQSPLYKAYLNTGVKILSGGEFINSPTSMSKELFEEFVDVLQVVRSAS